MRGKSVAVLSSTPRATTSVVSSRGQAYAIHFTRPLLFAALRGVRRTAVPTATIRVRVMRALYDAEADLAVERAATRAWRKEARRNRAWMRFFAIVGACGVVFGMSMLNALPSSRCSRRMRCACGRAAAWGIGRRVAGVI